MILLILVIFSCLPRWGKGAETEQVTSQYTSFPLQYASEPRNIKVFEKTDLYCMNVESVSQLDTLFKTLPAGITHEDLQESVKQFKLELGKLKSDITTQDITNNCTILQDPVKKLVNILGKYVSTQLERKKRSTDNSIYMSTLKTGQQENFSTILDRECNVPDSPAKKICLIQVLDKIKSPVLENLSPIGLYTLNTFLEQNLENNRLKENFFELTGTLLNYNYTNTTLDGKLSELITYVEEHMDETIEFNQQDEEVTETPEIILEKIQKNIIIMTKMLTKAQDEVSENKNSVKKNEKSLEQVKKEDVQEDELALSRIVNQLSGYLRALTGMLKNPLGSPLLAPYIDFEKTGLHSVRVVDSYIVIAIDEYEIRIAKKLQPISICGVTYCLSFSNVQEYFQSGTIFYSKYDCDDNQICSNPQTSIPCFSAVTPNTIQDLQKDCEIDFDGEKDTQYVVQYRKFSIFSPPYESDTKYFGNLELIPNTIYVLGAKESGTYKIGSDAYAFTGDENLPFSFFKYPFFMSSSEVDAVAHHLMGNTSLYSHASLNSYSFATLGTICIITFCIYRACKNRKEREKREEKRNRKKKRVTLAHRPEEIVNLN